jgi:excinuclease ABC subunit A
MISIRGARQHNLKGINLDLPDYSLIVITGVSGSGKSSLAFDTIYSEGQRRYIESFSSYARQFLEQLEKPDVDSIEGLSPSISIDQRGRGVNARSTVGTVTECYDYLRLLFARCGTPHCPFCNIIIEPQSVEKIAESINSIKEGTKIQLLAPLVRGRKGEYRELLHDLSSEGFSKVRINGEIHDLSEDIKLAKYKIHNIEVVVDRLKIKKDMGDRFITSLNLAIDKGSGTIIVIDGKKELLFSTKLACPNCTYSLDEIEPVMFSFNSPRGACPACSGIGTKKKIDMSLLINNKELSISEGAIPVLNIRNSVFMTLFKKVESICSMTDFNVNTPLSKIDDSIMDIILHGSSDKSINMTYRFGKKKGVIEYKTKFDGLINYLEKIYSDKHFEPVHEYIENLMIDTCCETCKGMRLKDESLSVKLNGKSIGHLSNMSIKDLYKFLSNVTFTPGKEPVGRVILKEINTGLEFLLRLGVSYLSLNRRVSTLAGGEIQRIRLATQISSGLTGVLYILDEPTVGLHQRDNEYLIKILEELRDTGNSIIVVEHDEEIMRKADYIVDLGPEAGIGGGHVVYEGTIHNITETESLTGQYLSGKISIPFPSRKIPDRTKTITIKGACANNLKQIDVTFYCGLFNCVTGVSGSGKSTLVNDILYPAIARILYRSKAGPGRHNSITGMEHIDKVVMVDQSPIGRTPRSNPATYTDMFTHIRDVFAMTQKSRLRGYKKGRFSFNVKGGRCEKCMGSGKVHIEMSFLPDIYITCDECKGKRYNSETLDVEYKGKNIFQVLEMTVTEGLEFFEDFPKIRKSLETLKKVGLGYIELGQPATFLSGGEAQRIKLSAELSKKSTGKTLYILDEPTTGLHFHDIAQLLKVLQELRDPGNTIIVIEHNMDVIKSADYIIDLGPEGGDEGGSVVAEGTPEEVADNGASHTGRFLRILLKRLVRQDLKL